MINHIACNLSTHHTGFFVLTDLTYYTKVNSFDEVKSLLLKLLSSMTLAIICN